MTTGDALTIVASRAARTSNHDELHYAMGTRPTTDRMRLVVLQAALGELAAVVFVSSRFGMRCEAAGKLVTLAAIAFRWLERICREELRTRTMTATDEVFSLTVAERAKNRLRWGDQSGNTPEIWVTVLSEEVGEVSRALLERSPLDHLRAELVQVLAVCIAWLELQPAPAAGEKR
jgi:hypothetical protein